MSAPQQQDGASAAAQSGGTEQTRVRALTSLHVALGPMTRGMRFFSQAPPPCMTFRYTDSCVEAMSQTASRMPAAAVSRLRRRAAATNVVDPLRCSAMGAATMGVCCC